MRPLGNFVRSALKPSVASSARTRPNSSALRAFPNRRAFFFSIDTFGRVRVLLQRIDTCEYWAGPEGWTRDVARAVDFKQATSAERFAPSLTPMNVRLIFKFQTGEKHLDFTITPNQPGGSDPR